MLMLTRFKVGRPLVVFCLLLAPLAALRVVLVLGRRIPVHDAFQMLQMQYTFFNEAALHGHGGLPQWLPFGMQGTPSAYWLMIAQGILPATVSAVAPLLKGANFLDIFEAGFFFDELILLLGCVLLARRCYRSLAPVVFVSVSIVYTAISSAQPTFDFHLYYLLPLILYCLDRAIRDASALHLFLMGIFGAATLLGNVAYSAPLTSFILCTFAVSAYLYAPREARASLLSFSARLTWRHLIAVLVPLAALGALGAYLTDGFAHLALRNPGRGAHGQVNSVTDFLLYGGAHGFGKYAELISRFPNSADITVYAGLLVVPFALVAFIAARSRLAWVFGTTALVLGLVSGGTLVSVLFYYIFPFGKFFRHIGLVAPVAKLFLVFYAGFGFEAFWVQLMGGRRLDARSGSWRETLVILAPVLAMGIILLILLIQRFRYPDFASAQNELVLLAVGCFVVLWVSLRWPRRAWVLGVALLALHGIDVFSLKVEREYQRSLHANNAVMALFGVYDYHFPAQRTQDYYTNGRFAALAPFIRENDRYDIHDIVGGHPAGGGRHGELYSVGIESFVFLDAVAAPFRTDFWLDGIDAFYRAWVYPSQNVPYRLGFPFPRSAAYGKLSGLTRPKIQFFERIHALRDEQTIAGALAKGTFAGDLVFTTVREAARDAAPDPSVVDLTGRFDPSANERLRDAAAEVRDFTFDRLRLRVSAPAHADSILYYADAWHPDWHAVINGKSVPVIRANLGYKAVILPAGHSDVTFFFGDWRTRLLVESTVGLAMAALAGVLFLLPTDLGRVHLAAAQSRRIEHPTERTGRCPPDAVGRPIKTPGRHRTELLFRSGLVFGATYFFWNVYAGKVLGALLWHAIRVIAPTQLWLIPLGIVALASAWSGLLAYPFMKTDGHRFVQMMTILGLLLDALSYRALGALPRATQMWLILHVAALVAAGTLSGYRNLPNVTRILYAAGAIVLVFAWIGSPLDLCYIPRMPRNAWYLLGRDGYVIAADDTIAALNAAALSYGDCRWSVRRQFPFR